MKLNHGLWGILCLSLLNVLPSSAQFGYAAVTKKHTTLQTEKRLTVLAKKEKLGTVLESIQKQTKFSFVYSNDEINTTQRVSINAKDKSLAEVMQELVSPIGIVFEILNDKIILRPEKPVGPLAEGGAVERPEQAGTINAAAEADVTITGRVTDENGAALEGVSVTIKGSNTGTVTNASGYYNLNVPESQLRGTLVFSFVGYQAQEVPINQRLSVSVQLASSSSDLGEVVVVGYGTQTRTSVTGAVDKIAKEAIEGRPVVNVSQALQGTSPNLIIQQSNFEPGQGVNINIRGLGTLGDNSPLVVIDGIIGGDINLLNPNDIDNVSVLKDAGAAAIYGSRSANGVLLVTTKKGRKNAKPTVTYSGIVGVQKPRVTYEPVHAWENATYKNLSLVNSGLQPLFSPAQIQQFAENGDGDWRTENLLKDAMQQSHNVTFSGGSSASTYLLSVGFLDQQNNFVGPGYGYKRYNIRFNQTTDIGRLKLTSILSYVKNDGKDHSMSSGTILVDAARVPLYYSFTDDEGNYLTNPVSAELNPKAILERGGFRHSNDDEIFGSFNAEVKVTNDLKIRGGFGGTVRSNHQFGRRNELRFQPGGQYGLDREVFDNNFKSLLTNTQLIAEYGKKLGDHDIRGLVGVSNESYKEEANRLRKTLVDPILGTPTTGTVIDETGYPNGSYNTNLRTIERRINSLFGRFAYSFADKYFAEVNFRYDAASVFSPIRRNAFFPSGSLAWRLSQEEFMDGYRNNVGDIKLRASYGILGNQNVNAYQYLGTYENQPNAYGFNNSIATGARYIVGNPELSWERSATTNLGVDASFLNQRLNVSVDYFIKTTTGILFPREDVPDLYGFPLPDFNVAQVRNRGWDLRVSYSLPGTLFNHRFDVNLGDNLNELLSLTGDVAELRVRREEFEFLRRVGQPITTYYGYRTNGFYQTVDELDKEPKFANTTVSPGDLKYVDRNGDGVIDDNDKFILGNPFPRYTFGFTYSVNVKNFDLMLFVQGVGRREAMLRGEQVEPFHFGYGGTMYRHQTDFWTPNNPNAKYPKLAEAGSPSNSNNYRIGSDIYLFDAAYARLKNLQIGYTFRQQFLSKAGIQSARFYVTGQNLITLSKLPFLDPEITEFNNRTNIDAGANSARAYPLPVFYGMGLTVNF